MRGRDPAPPSPFSRPNALPSHLSRARPTTTPSSRDFADILAKGQVGVKEQVGHERRRRSRGNKRGLEKQDIRRREGQVRDRRDWRNRRQGWR